MAKKVKVFSFVRVSDKSMVASVRIARFMGEHLDVPVVTDESVADEPLDVLVIINGAYAFSKALEPLGRAIVNAKKVVWVQNDYTIIPPKPESAAQSPFRKAFVDRRAAGKPDTMYWSTCEDWATLPGSSYVNWNALTFDPECDEGTIKKRRRDASGDLFYYGSYRAASGKSSRVKYFDRYFQNPRVRVTISTPAKQFAERYSHPEVVVVPAITEDFYGTLGRHGAGLYIEDRMSHERFHSPANRFYEMLSAGLPIVFQPECGTMFRRAGYDPTPYQASTPLEVQRALEKREAWGRQQREAWGAKAKKDRDELPVTVKKLLRELLK